VKRVLTSLTTFLVVVVIFALIVSPLRQKTVDLTILFFPTITTSVEALTYAAFFLGLILAASIAIEEDIMLRKRCRKALLDQKKLLNDATASPSPNSTVNNGEHKPSE